MAAVTGALLRWPLLAVLALRRNGRLASHPVLFAKTSHLFLGEYLDKFAARLQDQPLLGNSESRFSAEAQAEAVEADFSHLQLAGVSRHFRLLAKTGIDQGAKSAEGVEVSAAIE